MLDRIFSAHNRIAWVVFVAALLPALFVWHILRQQALEHAEAQFDLHVREIVNAIEQRLYQHEQILLGGAGLFDANGEVTREAWRAYVERLQLKKNYPGIQGVGFSRAIPPADLERHVAAMRAEGFPDYVVKPAGKRGLYTSIVYLEPFSGRNLAAFGYDMFSQETRRKAMQRAVDSAGTTISAKVKLLQETHGKPQAGFLMYVPVYRAGLPLTTQSERWRALKGFVYSPYRVDDLMRGILGERDTAVDFAIHQGGAPIDDGVMHDSRAARPLPAGFQPRFTTIGQITAYGEDWTLTFHSRPDFEAQFSSQREWLILALGLGISLSLFGLTSSLSNRQARAQELANEMTAQIRAEQARLHALNERFELATEAAGIGVWEFDLDTGRLFWDRQMQGLYQIEAGDFSGTLDDWRARVHLEDIDAVMAMQAASKRGEAPFDTSFRVVWRNGEIRHIKAFAKVLRDERGEPTRMIGVNYDITERKVAEASLRESEKRFRFMLESCPTAARIARSGGHEVIFSNRRYAELLNAAAAQVQGVDPASYYAHPEDYADILSRIGAGEQIFDRLVELNIPGAGTKWTIASYLPLQYEGQPAVLGWFYDITELKHAEQAILDQARHTQAILDNTVDGIITIDARGQVASFNKAAVSIFGYPPEEVVGHNVKMLMPEPYQSEHDRYLENYMATGVARIIGIGREVTGRRKDGETFPMELAVSEIQHQGRPLFIGMTRDITERKRVERMKSEFVSTVSHELRTPLTAISGALGLIVGGALGELPAQARQMIEIAHKNSLRLSHLINDLLDMEKIAAGKLRFDMQPHELMPLIEQALEANRAYGAERRVSLLLTQEAPATEVRVDSQRLMQILSNLLSNAIKYSPEDGTVEISVARRDQAVRVTVADHGPGIPASFHERIFQKFAQADSSDTREKGGTGLGLAITRELVERMGGRIGFDSVEGEGTRFHFELPLWQARAATAVDLSPAGMAADAPRILVVEDEPDIANLLGLMLGRAGYAVATAHSGSEALQALARTRYAAMTLDLMLPDISGLEVIYQARQHPKTADLPIIVVSARVEEGRLAVNGDFSGVDWLAKPIDEARLVGAIRQLAALGTTDRPRVLHVEDDADLHAVVRGMLGAGFDFELAPTLREARARLGQACFDVVLLDLSLPDGSGWELLPEIRERQANARVIILSGTDITPEQTARAEAALLKTRVSPRDLLDALNTRIQPPHQGEAP